MNLITVRLPAKSTVYLLEDSPMRIAWFKKQVPGIVVVSSVEEFKTLFDNNPPCDFIFWDHDLGKGGTGYDAAEWFANKYGAVNRYMLIHSWNRAGAARMQTVLKEASYVPFGNFEIEVEN